MTEIGFGWINLLKQCERDVSMDQDDLALAGEFVSRLANNIDPGIFEVTLFGSRARGDATEESDLDLFVALKQEDPRKEIEKLAFDIACDLTLDSGILVSVLVADPTFLRRHAGFAILEAVREDGVPL